MSRAVETIPCNAMCCLPVGGDVDKSEPTMEVQHLQCSDVQCITLESDNNYVTSLRIYYRTLFIIPKKKITVKEHSRGSIHRHLVYLSLDYTKRPPPMIDLDSLDLFKYFLCCLFKDKIT